MVERPETCPQLVVACGADPGARDAQSREILLHHRDGAAGDDEVLARDLGRHVYTLDLRNHGDSAHSPRHDYLAMAADVASFIRHHQLTKPTLIGHSMGAKTAMTLALQEPDTVHDLVSVDNAPIDAVLGSDFGRYVQAMRKIEAAAVTKQAEADKILEPYEPNVTIRQFLLGNLHRPRGADDAKTTLAFRVPLGVLGRALDHMGDFPFRDAAAARFPGRALFVRGTRSRYVADESIPAIGAFFPRFELVDVDAGHWLISESPEEFRRAVVGFLASQEC
ncbi:hypothetical protein P8C59_006621 [Phyllachora maydis]|uniref:AB hydrolase-1 domain-containing protein n=1 Tax=Phyllachora maydis TaxID=1825666 RepID=A0AAD9MCQ3_9PEZI|nr:hypothetical protein P8C59_006621 [Phyllachora maydis]